jgi:hypothetical protein
MITSDTTSTREITSRIAMEKNNIREEEGPFHLWNLRKRLLKCYIWRIALYSIETWTLRKIYQKYLKICKIWCWKTIDRVKEEMNTRVYPKYSGLVPSSIHQLW